MKLAAKRALARKIHRGDFDRPFDVTQLKGMKIGLLPDTERAREAMEAHAEMLKKASEAK